MDIEAKQREIIDEFSHFHDWIEKYEHLIELGRDLPLIAADKKTNDRLIEGCQSRVWLDAAVTGGAMRLTADSDAIITKGIIGLLIRVLNNESPTDISRADLHFIGDIGLSEHLSPTRANGLANMVRKIKLLALTALDD